MKERYKYIHFEWIEDKPNPSVWECRNNRSKEVLGWVEWYNAWRCYCFCPGTVYMVFSADCLADIIDFINQCMKEHKSNRDES